MLITPLLVRLSDALAPMLETPHGQRLGRVAPDAEGSSRGLVVIGGYGRVGHTVATLLHASGVPVVVIDTDPARVAQGRDDGLQVYYGDVGDPELLIHAGIATAALVVLTVDKAASAERSIAHIRTNFPTIPIVSRARDLAAVSRLLAAGANKALPDVIESSMRLSSLALEMLNIPEDGIEMLVHGVREQNYELISGEPAPRAAATSATKPAIASQGPAVRESAPKIKR